MHMVAAGNPNLHVTCHNRMQGYELFGFTRDGGATVYREWAPAAQSAQLIGDFNGWQGTPLERDDFGVWSVRLPDGAGCSRSKQGAR